jgi:hypothetical protein
LLRVKLAAAATDIPRMCGRPLKAKVNWNKRRKAVMAARSVTTVLLSRLS